MGGRLSKKGFSVAYEKLTAKRVEEEATKTATVKSKESEEVQLAAESMGLTTQKRDSIADGMEDKEGGKVPAVGLNKTCKSEPKQLDLVPNEEQLVAPTSDKATKSPEADPSQLLEVTAIKDVYKRLEEDAE